MKSFRIILVRNFTGTIFITFLVVYLLFHALTGNFISEEARRELTREVTHFENVTYDNIMPRLEGLTPVRRLFMNSDSIIINAQNEIVSPNPNTISEESAEQILFLANYFFSSPTAFANEEPVRITNATNAFYLQAVEFAPTQDFAFTFLFYTDITSAMFFIRNISVTLRILLVVSSLVSVFISVLISTQVQNAILRLCKYAGIIGSGKFTEKTGNFPYKEFNDLAESMNSMSNKLDDYENNQKQFFQNVSHELRTPLMSIQGYTEAIAADVMSKDEATAIILAESERMENLVNQLLYISRMDSGLDALKLTTFSLKNTLYDCIGRVKILADKSNKEMTFSFPEDDPQIKSDEEKLQRAIDNILTNCTRHANTKINIEYVIESENAKITITDDGKGINEADLPHIFKRFYKGENGNSGLGLAISQDIIEKLNGIITAENKNPEESPGARFVIIIPI